MGIRGKALTQEQKKEIELLTHEGWTTRRISANTKIPISTIERHLYRHHPEKSPVPEGIPALPFDPLIAQVIIDRYAAGESLTKISQSDDMPSYNLIAKWIKGEEAECVEFKSNLDKARDIRAQALIDKAQAAAEGSEAAIAALGNDRLKTSSAVVNAKRLQAEVFMKIAAKEDRARWGDKVEVSRTDTLDLSQRFLAAIEAANGLVNVTPGQKLIESEKK